MTTKIQNLIADYTKARAAFLAQGKEAVGAMFKQFFIDNPGVKRISWTQYSPYFNDGEECVFGVHAPVFSNDTKGEMSRYGEYDGDDENVWAWGDDVYEAQNAYPTSQEITAMTELDALIQGGALDDVFEDLFGNHVEVIVTPEGIETEEYDHD